MQITNDIKYIGVNDHDIDLFEGQYIVENGMAYNSYVIMDEKIAVMDTVDTNFEEEWLNNLKAVLNDRTPDYLIVQHMEPDHSASIDAFVKAYPETVIVASAPAFTMMKQFFGTDYADKRQVIKEGDSLSLGAHTLQFVAAPMVHWPEVMVTYDAKDKVLFSADGFGKFGALDADEDWACEARRYYFGIVGKYGMQVQNLLKKAAALDIQIICLPPRARQKRSKTWGSSSGGIPRPWSVTSRTKPPASRARVRPTVPPGWENFTALSSSTSSICRSRP